MSPASVKSGHVPHTAHRALIQAAVISAPTSMVAGGGARAAAPRASSSHRRKVRQAEVRTSLMDDFPVTASARRGPKTAAAQCAGRVMRGGGEHADFLGLVDFPKVSSPLAALSSRPNTVRKIALFRRARRARQRPTLFSLTPIAADGG